MSETGATPGEIREQVERAKAFLVAYPQFKGGDLLNPSKEHRETRDVFYTGFRAGRESAMIPGPLPHRDDNYVTDDPEPWVRPWSGERAPHTGVNLYGSGYTFQPRPEFDEPTTPQCGYSLRDENNYPWRCVLPQGHDPVGGGNMASEQLGGESWADRNARRTACHEMVPDR